MLHQVQMHRQPASDRAENFSGRRQGSLWDYFMGRRLPNTAALDEILATLDADRALRARRAAIYEANIARISAENAERDARIAIEATEYIVQRNAERAEAAVRRQLWERRMLAFRIRHVPTAGRGRSPNFLPVLDDPSLSP
jgi:hypothetical protein